MQILDGKATAARIRLELKEAVEKRKSNGEKTPHLAAILVGSDGGVAFARCPAAVVFIRLSATFAKSTFIERPQLLATIA